MCNSFTSLLANYVYTKHTPLSFASWCMLHIHNSASLRGVCADTPLSFASLVYLLHIHNSAAPRLCIFPYTILSSDVRHYYISPRKTIRFKDAFVLLLIYSQREGERDTDYEIVGVDSQAPALSFI